MSRIHPTAVVDSRARIERGCEIGPYSIVGPDVELGAGVSLSSQVVVQGRTRVGSGTRISPFAVLGGEPQHLRFSATDARLEIGRENVIREHVTLHVGTVEGGGCTRVGDRNYIMNGAHVAHDCQVGSDCVIGSFSGLAGHVVVEDHAVLGAYTGVHQHARVGESAMAASGAKLSLDAVPFSMVAGDRARLVGLNSVGLQRRGFSEEVTRALKRAFHVLFRSKTRLEEALVLVRRELSGQPEVERVLGFVENSERGFCR